MHQNMKWTLHTRRAISQTGFVTALHRIFGCMREWSRWGRSSDGRRDEEYLNWLTCNVWFSLYEFCSLCQWQWKYLAKCFVSLFTFNVWHVCLIGFIVVLGVCIQCVLYASASLRRGVIVVFDEGDDYYSYWIRSKKNFFNLIFWFEIFITVARERCLMVI